MSEPVVDIHPEVLSSDTQDIANFIAMDDEEAAARVLAAIDDSYHYLAHQLQMGTDIHPLRRTLHGIRMFPVTDYPNYLIYYRPLPKDAGVRILYVLHAARDAIRFTRDHRRQ